MKPDFSKMSLVEIMNHYKEKGIFKVELPSYVSYALFQERVCTLSYKECFDMTKVESDPYFVTENRWLRSQILEQIFSQIGGDYVNHKGRFIKRFEKAYEEKRSIKLSQTAKSLIGDIVREITVKVAYYVDFVDEIDWEDGNFGKEDSCWWGCYSESRDVFIDGGGWGIRFYTKDEDGNFEGIGRVWVFPFESYKTFVLFNAYYDFGGGPLDQFARLLANLCGGLIYKKVNVYNSPNREVPFINNETGYAVSFTGEFREGYNLNLGYPEYSCSNCGDTLSEEECYYFNDDNYCGSCYRDRFSDCDICGNTRENDDLIYVEYTNQNVCERCLERRFSSCSNCGESIDNDDIKQYKEDYYCPSCYDELNISEDELETSEKERGLKDFRIGDHVIFDPDQNYSPYSITDKDMIDAKILHIYTYNNPDIKIRVLDHVNSGNIGETYDVNPDHFIRNLNWENKSDAEN